MNTSSHIHVHRQRSPEQCEHNIYNAPLQLQTRAEKINNYTLQTQREERNKEADVRVHVSGNPEKQGTT